MVTAVRRDLRPLTLVSVAVAVWGLCYALYRSYYALGGTLLLPGTPADPTQFRRINAAAVVILTVAAVLPVAVLPLWRRRRAQAVLLVVCWLVAVGCSMHALIDIIQRVLSLAGLLRIEYPATVWASIDHRTADLQDLFFNEPWFLIEGLGFGALAWIVLGPGSPGSRRRWWVGSAIAATLALTVIGLLSATGVIGRVIIS
jgi:uncharacterized protein with PQ loop repeat